MITPNYDMGFKFIIHQQIVFMSSLTSEVLCQMFIM